MNRDDRDPFILLVAFVLLCCVFGCGDPNRTPYHTWGELGFYQWNKDNTIIPEPTPVPPEVWEKLQKDEIDAAPEEPKKWARKPDEWRV